MCPSDVVFHSCSVLLRLWLSTHGKLLLQVMAACGSSSQESSTANCFAFLIPSFPSATTIQNNQTSKIYAREAYNLISILFSTLMHGSLKALMKVTPHLHMHRNRRVKTIMTTAAAEAPTATATTSPSTSHLAP